MLAQRTCIKLGLDRSYPIYNKNLQILIGPIEKGKRFNVSEMRKNCSVVVIMNQLAITWYAGANVGVFVVCLLLIAEQIAHDTPDTGMLTNSEVLIYPWYGTAI